MAEFVEITTDPYINQTDKFLVVVGIKTPSLPYPTAGQWVSAESGVVKDPNSNVVSNYFVSAIYQASTGDTYAATASTNRKVVVPPGYSIRAFGTLTGFFVTLEELPQWL